jgi:hypothetical protein
MHPPTSVSVRSAPLAASRSTSDSMLRASSGSCLDPWGNEYE